MADFYDVHRRAIARGMAQTKECEYFHISMQEPFSALTGPTLVKNLSPTFRIATFLHGVGGRHLPADKTVQSMIDEWQAKYGCVDAWGFPD